MSCSGPGPEGAPAFAKPEIYEELEQRAVKYAIRIPANDSLERDFAELLTHPVGRPSQEPVVWYKSFLYQAALRGDGRKDRRLAGGDVVDAGDGRSKIRRPRGEGWRGVCGMR